MFQAKILADSIAQNGCRLTTMEVCYPRFIHSEHLRHREMSFNVASSRALPLKKTIQGVIDNPVIPIHWGKNESGMVANQEIDIRLQENARAEWILARDNAVKAVQVLNELGIHKQIANRLLEPFSWTTVITSSTNWKHFFNLRCSPDAEPHIQKIAYLMRETLENSVPNEIGLDEWHLPLVFKEDQDLSLEIKKKISVARCGRVSYLTHDGKRDISKDLELYDRLVSSKHWSPTEHVATPLPYATKCGNFTGWKQHRKEFANEHII